MKLAVGEASRLAVVGLTFAIPAVVAMPQRKFSDAVTILSSDQMLHAQYM